MATVVSLTETKIQELMAGWEGVSLSQDEINALIGQLWTDVGSQGANLEEFENVTLPALEADLAAGSIAVSDLTANTIPDLINQLDINELEVTNLKTVDLPLLTARVASNEGWIIDLNDVILPELYGQLDANNVLITTFNDVTLPDLQSRLTAVEGSTGFDPTELNAAIAELEGKFPVVGDDIAADTITSNNIEAHTITALEIAADTITANEIAADSITANEIAAHTITSAEIFADTITANEIATDTITANEIAADTITANEIAADSITASEIAADTITANEIATDAVTANEIAAHTITAAEIFADTITANEIATDTITANEIATGTITALEIAGGTITGEKIAADTIAVTKLIVSDLTNLIVDGDLLDPTSATWYQVGVGHMQRVKAAGERAYMKNTNTYSSQYIYFRNENVFEIKTGDEFAVSLEVMTPSTNTVNATFSPYLAVFNRDGGSELWRGPEEGVTVFPPNTPWTVVQGTIKITEDGLATAQFNPIADVGTGVTAGTQEVRVRKMTLRRKSAGRLIIDGTIEGKHIQANTITSDQIDVGTITGDLFAAEVILGGLMRAGDLDEFTGLIAGGYSEMGARGIYTVDDAGEPVFYAPTSSADGAYLKAHVDLLSADVRDNFTMHGTNNSIATEAELTLSAGVEAPSVPPVLQQVWDQIQFNKTTAVPPHTPSAGFNLGTFAFSPSQVTSICWDSTWNCWCVTQQKSTGFRVWRFTAAGAIYNNFGTGRPWVDDYNDRINSSMCFNDDANVNASIFKSGDDWWVWAPENIARIPASWIIDAASRPPTLTYDTAANQYCLVQSNGGGTGTIHVRRFTVPSSGTYPNAVSVSANNFEAGSGLSSRINGAVFGSQLGVASSWAISCDDYATTYTFSGAGVMYNDEGSYRNWSKPGLTKAFGHNGLQFASIDSAGLLTLYENWTWTSIDSTIWIGASAADTDSGVGSNLANPHVGQVAGTHETPVGTMKSIGLYRRSKLRITMPETLDSGGADDPDKWRLYFKRGLNVAPTDKTLLKLIGDIGSPTAPTSITISADATGGNPPGGIAGQPTAYNNFPGADPGRIESAGIMAIDSLPILQMLGSGAGRWGTLTVDVNGKAVIGGDTGWIAPTLLNGWTNYPSGYATCGYRRIGNRVFLRGLLVPGTAGTAVPIFNLPVGCRPLFREIFSGNGGTREFAATGDSPPTFNTGAASAGTGHNHPVNSPALDIRVDVTAYAGRIDVSSDGNVLAANDMGSYQSISGISFLID